MNITDNKSLESQILSEKRKDKEKDKVKHNIVNMRNQMLTLKPSY
jgi:hypothetical protein